MINQKTPKSKYKLVAFDLDGTIIDGITSAWSAVHEQVKTSKEYRKKTWDLYHSGKISYDDWAKADIREWKKAKVTKTDILKAFKKTKLMKNARSTILKLKKQGFRLAIISGSFDVVMEKLMPDYREIFDDILLTEIYFEKNGKLKGIKCTKFDYEHKLTGLKLICKKEKITLDECVFVGDNLNDIEIATHVGLSIAFCPNSKDLEKVSDVVVKKRDLSKILKHI